MSYKFDPENPFKRDETELQTAQGGRQDTEGVKVEHFFSTEGVHPFDELEWETRSAKIAGDSGDAIFEQDNIEVPVDWSQLATKVVASKYFYGDSETGEREHSLKQLVHRVAKAIADRGRKDGYFGADEDAETFYNELVWLCTNQYGSFNSPAWFNVGPTTSMESREVSTITTGMPKRAPPCLATEVMSIHRPRPASFSRSKTPWKT
jgi:hypothetical protein